MRLLFYQAHLSGGGAERVWAILASELHRRGHEVAVVCEPFGLAPDPALDPAIEIVTLPAGRLRQVRALAALLRARRPDAAFSALGAPNLKLVAAAAGVGASRRVVLSYHGHFAAEPAPLARLSYLLTPALTRIAGATVAVSEELRADLLARFRASPARTRRIYNPAAPVGVKAPDRAALKARAPIVLAVGRLSPVKDFPLLVEAFAGLGEPAARLVIVGEGGEREAIADAARRLGVADRVEMKGHVADPGRYYARAKCFALSSRSEAFGNVVVEALARGLPVVSTDCGGPAEILRGEGLGELTAIGEARAMTAALARALADPGDPAPRLRRAADFSIAAAVDAYEALARELTRQSTRTG